MKILTLLLFASVAIAQPKDRVLVKNMEDGFKIGSTAHKMTVAQLEKIPLIKVKNNSIRMAEEQTLIQVSGRIVKMQKEADGDIHCEISDGTCKDSTLACEFPDPAKAKKSVYVKDFATARNFILTKKVGDIVVLTGMEFQDKFHSPSPKRIRNFIEIHPVLNAQ